MSNVFIFLSLKIEDNYVSFLYVDPVSFEILQLAVFLVISS